jgi:hypothetical protein
LSPLLILLEPLPADCRLHGVRTAQRHEAAENWRPITGAKGAGAGGPLTCKKTPKPRENAHILIDISFLFRDDITS